jgi:hypothetical protein
MTKQNKLIVGAVVVLGAYYLYDRNKKMNAVSDLKAGADVTEVEVAEVPTGTGGIKPSKIDVRKALMGEQISSGKFQSGAIRLQDKVTDVEELNFAGRRGNSYFETIF